MFIKRLGILWICALYTLRTFKFIIIIIIIIIIEVANS